MPGFLWRKFRANYFVENEEIISICLWVNQPSEKSDPDGEMSISLSLRSPSGHPDIKCPECGACSADEANWVYPGYRGSL